MRLYFGRYQGEKLRQCRSIGKVF